LTGASFGDRLPIARAGSADDDDRSADEHRHSGDEVLAAAGRS
jgi:hypothetical protein